MAVLPPALAVALPGDGRHAAAGLAELAGGQPEVDGGEHVVDALGLLFDAAGVEHHPGGRGTPQLGGLLDAGGGDASDVSGPCGGHVGGGRGGLVEVDRVGVDELVVEPVVADQLVEHCAEEGRIAAGADREEQVRGSGERDDAGVLDDELRPPVAGPPDVARGDRERLGDVGPGDPDHVGERDVAPGVRRAVDPERLLVADAGRHHAVAAVVVEVGGVEREPGELADQVALLVGERDARQHGEGVVAVARPGCAGSRRRPRSSASSQLTRRNPPGADWSRTIGCSSRSGWLPCR